MKWIPLEETAPEFRRDYRDPKPYVLVCDAKGRMSVAFRHGSHLQAWTMAKPIGLVTHWMPLPPPPEVKP